MFIPMYWIRYVFRFPLYDKSCDTIELIQCISANTLNYIIYLASEKTKKANRT